MKTRTLVPTKILVLVVLICIHLPLYADKGSIPFNANVQIFEPNQRALIAWNGLEEILLLTTDLYASETTKILEVIPLPSEPEVEKGRSSCQAGYDEIIVCHTIASRTAAPQTIEVCYSLKTLKIQNIFDGQKLFFRSLRWQCWQASLIFESDQSSTIC